MSTGKYHTIEIDLNALGVCTMWLNRPEVHNAFNEVMIDEITESVQQIETDDAVRVLCVKGKGRSFCAGADLNWMKRTAEYSQKDNYRDAMRMAGMMYALYSFSKPTVAIVQGSIFGGGVGLISSCDIVVSESSAIFSLSEVKLGLIPAVIGPYVVSAMGSRIAKRYILTGERFDAEAALQSGLVHEMTDSAGLSEVENKILRELLACGPEAQKTAKSLIINKLSPAIDEEIQTHTAGLIAKTRASEEGREGVGAFLAKRRPMWLES